MKGNIQVHIHTLGYFLKFKLSSFTRKWKKKKILNLNPTLQSFATLFLNPTGKIGPECNKEKS